MENTKARNQNLNYVPPAYLVKTSKKALLRFKMRCKICEKVVKCANVPTRTRRICGNCLRSLIKLINTAPIKRPSMRSTRTIAKVFRVQMGGRKEGVNNG